MSNQRTGSVMVGLIFGAGLAVSGWFAIGPDHGVYAVVVQGAFLFMALLVGPAVVDVARSRYRVRQAEVRIYVVAGAELVRRLLDRVGWNRIIARERRTEKGATGRDRFLRGTEQSENAHLLGIIATVLLAGVAALTTHLQGAAQITVVGLVLHGYPVMIQRIVRFRLARHRTGTDTNTA